MAPVVTAALNRNLGSDKASGTLPWGERGVKPSPVIWNGRGGGSPGARAPTQRLEMRLTLYYSFLVSAVKCFSASSRGPLELT